MPPESPKIMDSILHKTKNTFNFIDDILIVLKGTKEEHLEKVEEAIKVLDEVGVCLKTEKCKIEKRETEWLGYKLAASEKKTCRRKGTRNT